MMEVDAGSMQHRTLREGLYDAGRDFCLASLGAVALIEKQGRTAFEALVQKGRDVEARDRATIDRAVSRITGQVRELGSRVELGLQNTGKAVLQRLGVPSHAEITALIARVEQLTAKVEAISGKEAVDDQEG
jgi:poly(hydroxyalkanoate) granule-associated protein